MVQQLDGAPTEGRRDVQERQYGVPLEDPAREEHHVADVVPYGDRHDGVNELGRQTQRRQIPNCSRRTASSSSQCVLLLAGWGMSPGASAAQGGGRGTAPSSFLRHDAHRGRRVLRDRGNARTRILGTGSSSSGSQCVHLLAGWGMSPSASAGQGGGRGAAPSSSLRRDAHHGRRFLRDRGKARTTILG